MGVSIPQVVTETKASGAQIIDGSLKFDKASSNYLKKTISTTGNQKTFTVSAWFKKCLIGTAQYLFTTEYLGSGNYFEITMLSGQTLQVYNNKSTAVNVKLERLLRDTGWFHAVIAIDTTQATSTDRVKIYINGERQTDFDTVNGGNAFPAQDYTFELSNSRDWLIGTAEFSGSISGSSYDGHMSQFNFIDGQQLDASYFGFTDPLTNTWRPKKLNLSDVTSGKVFVENTYTGGTVGAGIYNAALTGTQTAGSYSGDTFTATNAGWVITFDLYEFDSFTLSDVTSSGQSNETWYYSNDSSFASGVTGPNSGTIANGTWSTTVSGTKYRYLRLQNVPSITFSVVGNITNSQNAWGTNGFYLPMDGNSPIGEDKSGIVTINDGRTWSNSLASSSGFRSSEPKTNAFDGNTSSICSAVDNGIITFTSPVTFASSSTIKVVVHGGDHTVTVNGGADQTISAGSLQTVTYSNSGNATFVMTFQRATVADTGVRAIEINGVILTDGLKGNSWTPVNFGGSVALDNPIVSGARPILNTDGGGNVARVGVFGSEVGAYYAVTVSNPGSGNKYYLDGVLTPTPTFYRGSTYTFDYTAATSHPLYLSALSDGKHNSKAYSVQFDGTGDYLTLAQSNDFDLTGDYTYEAFIYYTDTTNNPTIFDFSAASGNYEGRLQIQAGTLYLYNAGWVSKGAISANTWHHIAVTQDFIFVDGINIGSGTGAISGSNYKVVTIGARTNNGGTSYGDYFTGYISNARIVNGTALYTENFTVPTTTLTNVTNTKLLCCQDNNATTAVVAPGGITAVGNAAASNTYNPFVYNIDNYFGVDASTSNVTKQVIPHSAVDTLYYFCNIHSGMGGSANIVTDETKADPYAWKNVLATPLVGSANDISNSVNSGSTTKTITVASDAASNTAQSNFYGASFYFDGTDDRLFSSTSSDYTFGTGDFTIEGWVHPVANNANKTVFSTNWGANGSILITFSHPSAGGAGKFGFFDYTSSSGSPKVTTSNAYPINTWHHVAFVRNGTSHKFYINGIEDGTAGYSASDLTRDAFIFGAVYTNGTETFNGYMSDVRVYKGVAKYTSNFVVPATSPDILPDTPSGVSGSSKLAKVIDGAVSFDGSGDYLLSGASSDYNLGTGNFTIEGYIYPNSASGTQGIMGIGNAVSPACQIFYNVSNSQKVRFNVTDGTAIESTGTAPAKAWSHFAVVREGTGSNETKIYINGKLEAQGTISTNLTETTLQIGRPNTSSGTEYFNGFISNFRVIKGTALYTSSFTPPTRELTNVTNTKLLCCQSNTQAGAAAVSPVLVLLSMMEQYGVI